jgi:hypothetical protein
VGSGNGEVAQLASGVDGYELRLWIGLASYRIKFSVIGSNLLRYAGAHPTNRWAAVAGYWAASRAAGWAESVVRLGFGH